MIDETLINNFKNWFEKLDKTSLPQFDELPDFNLYMDQLINYLEIQSRVLETSSVDAQITPSMVNNYVKGKIVDAPCKKKYSREQIGELLELIYLKKVLSLPEIKQIFDVKYSQESSKEKSYNEYAEIKKAATRKAVQDAKVQLNDIDYKNKDEVIDAALDLAARANAYAVIAKRLLHTQSLLDHAQSKDEVIEEALGETNKQ